MTLPLHILLGRAGDILSLLPMLHGDAQAGNRPSLMVAKEYAPLLEGVSYVDAIAFAGNIWEIDRAYGEAKKISERVETLQVLGPPALVKKFVYEAHGLNGAVTDCWQKESWNLVGRIGDWHKGWPLVIDRRNKEREAKLCAEVLPEKKKVILLSAGGISSPFPYKDLLYELLHLKFGRGYAIVDISKLQAERLFDLVGLFEHPRVHCLVATDSAPLHLAYSTKVPVVALANDQPGLWCGSAPRPNHIFYGRYSEFPKRAVEMLDAMANIRKPGCFFFTNCVVHDPKIVHVWNGYEVDENNKDRHTHAADSWGQEYAKSPEWVSTPLRVGALGQDSSTVLKDKQRFPLLKAALKLAMLRASDADVLCLTRPDTQFKAGLTGDILREAKTGPLFARRNVIAENGVTYHPAIDLFAFQKKWWVAHVDELPDFIWGNDHFWHETLGELIRKYGGVELGESVYRPFVKPQVITTERPPNFYIHNEAMAKQWREKNPPLLSVLPVDKQLPTMFVNRRALFPLGYNGSIVQHENKILLCYRYHYRHDLSTQLAIAELDEAGNVLNNSAVALDGNSNEDPRCFVLRGELWVSYVQSNIGAGSFNCVQRYGRLVKDGGWRIETVHQPTFGKNYGSAMEKNWCPIVHENRLFFVYQSSPRQIVIRINAITGGDAVSTQECDTPHWRFGAIKGGTVPLPYKGKLLRFFHSRLDNESPPTVWRYRMGACLMEPTPPFKIIAVSERPLLEGSDVDDLSSTERFSCHHHKARVVIPYGALETKSGWLVSCGVNDSTCGLIKVKEEDLKL